MNLTDKRPIFRRVKPRSSPYRMLLWVTLILAGVLGYRGVQSGAIPQPFQPTPTPTRSIQSFEKEGDTYFQIGNLEAAIGAYLQATDIDPNNAELWTKLARIQTYSSASLTTDQDKLQRLKDARTSIERAIAADPERSDARAVQAFVLDWLASSALITPDEAKQYLIDAEQASTRALQLDEQNTQALAFKAEILVDQGKVLQAQQTIDQALQRAPDDMDVHRVNAYVLSSVQEYLGSVEEYKRAAELAPNLTYLYIQIGKIYRYLATATTDEAQRTANFDQALHYFRIAVAVNDRLGLKDPIPSLAIAKTYLQRGNAGDFFLAILENKEAIRINPGAADVYAQLGLTYHQSRNYEGAIEAFKCALEGCPPEESCKIRDDCDDPSRQFSIAPLPLTDTTVVYFYTYASLLSALSKATNNNCELAVPVFAKLRGSYASDSFVMSFVQAGESICAGNAAPRETSTPTLQTGSTTRTPAATRTP